MRQVALHGGGAEREGARDITERNAVYTASVHALFDATDAHDTALALALALALKIDHEQVDPVSKYLQDDVYAGHSCTTRPPRPAFTCNGSRRSG